MAKIRVALAEDNVLLREGVSRLVSANEEFELVGTASDLPQLLALAREQLPDVVVTDIRMPPTGTNEGIQAAAWLRENHPEVGVVVLSQYTAPAYAMALLEHGSSGRAYLLKERVASVDELARAIRAVAQGGSSLVGNAQLVTKVYFPRMAIPGAAVGTAMVDFAIASVILFAMMAWYEIAPGAGITMFPVLVGLLAIFAGAVGMWMAGMNVKYRDIKYVLPFILQLWMFATPVIYPASFVPAGWRWILMLNPLTGIIGGFRSALLNKAFEWPAIAVAAALTLASAAYSVWSFRRMERGFADVI